jgi:tetratricopeptide (TPR) repeat protein
MQNKIKLLLLLLLFPVLRIMAQEAAALDSLKNALAKATTVEEKISLMDELSRVMMNVNPPQADEMGSKLISLAEESRDRRLMITAYFSNGIRNSYIAVKKEYADKALQFFNKGIEIAQANRMEEEVGKGQLLIANLYTMTADKDNALKYASQAFSLISTLNNDSLKVESHNAYGRAYLSKNEKILALRNYFTALRIAEYMKKGTKSEIMARNKVLRNCYIYLSDFYENIEEYDKAIDYYLLGNKQLDGIDENGTAYQKVIDMNNLGRLYNQKKNYDIAIQYFERSIRMADSLKFSALKIPGYVSLLNQYLERNEPAKALAYLNSNPGDELKGYLSQFGLSYIIDQAYGFTYSEMGRFDSANYYLLKAKPEFEKGINKQNLISFYGQLAGYYKKSGDNKKAIEYYLKVEEMSRQNGLLERIRQAAKHLDTLYTRTGNIPMALKYSGVYYQYKDSIERIGREKEVAQVQATEEQLRLTRLAKEAEEAKKRRNNIQYMGITIGIVALFIMLVVLGMFKVSRGLIRAIGFFVFLLLFEFVFLVFKKNIYSVTNGEPLRDLLFMIGLAALLVPLHHWLEHRVLHYLTSHNRLTSAGHHIKNKLFRRTKEGNL